jgi:hypothetical protein
MVQKRIKYPQTSNASHCNDYLFSVTHTSAYELFLEKWGMLLCETGETESSQFQRGDLAASILACIARRTVEPPRRLDTHEPLIVYVSCGTPLAFTDAMEVAREMVLQILSAQHSASADLRMFILQQCYFSSNGDRMPDWRPQDVPRILRGGSLDKILSLFSGLTATSPFIIAIDNVERIVHNFEQFLTAIQNSCCRPGQPSYSILSGNGLSDLKIPNMGRERVWEVREDTEYQGENLFSLSMKRFAFVATIRPHFMSEV